MSTGHPFVNPNAGVAKGRFDPDSADYLARKQAEGKSRREALRCLKRLRARRVWRLLQPVSGPSVAIGERPPVIAAPGSRSTAQRPSTPIP